MGTLQLRVAYDGTRYAGWQVQKSAGNQKPTIQQALESAFGRILREQVKIAGSGRTDAGVHAQAQIAHLRTQSSMPVSRLLYSVNQLLPKDIAVLDIRKAADGFHARFGASSKCYRYRVFTGKVVPPFIRACVYPVRHPLDAALIRREASHLKGKHDFTAFARAGGQGSAVRKLYAVKIRKSRDELHFEFEGNGFLHGMVRSMVGTLLDIGRGRLPAGTIRRMLRTRQRRLAGTTAPACGLTLMRVYYRKS